MKKINKSKDDLLTDTIWILIDKSNSYNKQNTWYFETRDLARKHIKYMKDMHQTKTADLIGPYKYKRVK